MVACNISWSKGAASGLDGEEALSLTHSVEVAELIAALQCLPSGVGKTINQLPQMEGEVKGIWSMA